MEKTVLKNIKFILISAIFLIPSSEAFSVNAVCDQLRDKNGRIARSKTVVTQFRKNVPCPATGLIQTRCPGYVVDHTVPLCFCGPDALHNLQWQTIAEAKEKDKQERKLCRSNR